MEGLNNSVISEVKNLGGKKQNVKFNDNIVGPILQNIAGGLTITTTIIFIRLLNNVTIDSFQDIKIELYIGGLIASIFTWIRFLILDEGLLLAYKMGIITANTKNSVVNALSDIISIDNGIDIKILDCAKLIIKRYFTNQPFDTQTLLGMEFTRTQIDKARGLLIKSGVIIIDKKQIKFLVNKYDVAINKLKHCVESTK